MLHRNTALVIFPLVVLIWYLISWSWPPHSEITPLHPGLVPTTTGLLAPSLNPPDSISTQFAYVFYATNGYYACSAIVNFHRLRHELNSTIPGILLVSRTVSNFTIAAAVSAGLSIVRDDPPPLAPGGASYYSQVLLKLRALHLRAVRPELRRIIVLDADQLILKNLDHLFALPSTELAAPLAYWQGGHMVTTTLMVAELSTQLWDMVEVGLRTIVKNEYDMDLVNRVFGRRLLVLPGRYCTLNSHWESRDLPGWFEGGTETRPAVNGGELERLYDMAEVVHFTAFGKPWDVVVGDIHILKPGAHPLLGWLFVQWKKTAEDVCGWAPNDHSLQ